MFMIVCGLYLFLTFRSFIAQKRIECPKKFRYEQLNAVTDQAKNTDTVLKAFMNIFRNASILLQLLLF